MNYVTLLGSLAATLTVVAFFPQLAKVVRTRSTKNISLGMFSIFCAGVFLWFAYGVFTNDAPVAVANLFTFVQAVAILAYKVKYK